MVHAPAIYIHARFQGRARAVNLCKSDNPARKNSQKLHLFTVLQNYTYSYVENPSFHEHANHASIHSIRAPCFSFYRVAITFRIKRNDQSYAQKYETTTDVEEANLRSSRFCQDTDNESKSAGERGRKRRMKRAVKRKKDALSGTSSSASAETFTETQLLDIAPVSLPHPAFPRDRALRRRMEAAKTVQPTP